MGHLRLLLLVTATVSTAYLVVCLLAPTSLEFTWEESCPMTRNWREAGAEMTWALPLGQMMLTSAGTNASSEQIEVSGSWGRHRISIEMITSEDECRQRVFWQSRHWPFLLRGAAGFVSLRETVTLHLRHFITPFPSDDQENLDWVSVHQNPEHSGR